MSIEVFTTTILVLAVLPLAMGLLNLMFYRPLAHGDDTRLAMSVLVPARNEEARITPVIASILESEGADFELIVADDNSTDRTAEIINGFAAKDPRVRLFQTPPMTEGWSGKTNACYALSKQATHDIFVFLDADVTVSPDALARIARYMTRHEDVALLSGFPRQLTGSFWERLVIPMIHVLFLGYLPFIGLRFTRHPMFGAGCGQLMIARRDSYELTTGHAAIALSLHDGVTLPRLFRNHDLRTALFDATSVTATRMYESNRELWNGLSKNAHEAMATWIGLPIWTVLLVGGHIAPLILFIALTVTGAGQDVRFEALLATVATFCLRALMAARFNQSWLGVILHPLGVAYLLALQWVALIRRALGHSVSWRDRAYEAASGNGKGT
jgi:hypothetical protein